MGSICPPGTELWLHWGNAHFPSSDGRYFSANGSSKPKDSHTPGTVQAPDPRVFQLAGSVAWLSGCQDLLTEGSLGWGYNSKEELPDLPGAWSWSRWAQGVTLHACVIWPGLDHGASASQERESKHNLLGN